VSFRRPALIVLLFAAGSIPLLIVRAPFFDELFTRWISAKPFTGIVAALRFDSGPPLYYFLVRLIGDPSVTAIRILSLLLTAISLVLILRRRNLTAALLLAVFPPAILFAADARAYAMCAMFVTIAVLLIDDERPFAAALALVAAAYSHYYGVLFFPILFVGGYDRRRWYALAIAVVLFIPGLLLALHQPIEARAWMKVAWPDVLFVRPPIAIAIAGAIAVAMSIRVNRYALMVLIPLILAIVLRVYVPMRLEAVIAAPLALWVAESLKTNRFRVALTAAMVAVCVLWTTLGILDHASRPPEPYQQAATWVAGNIPANDTVVATGYLYLETMMSGHTRVAAFPPEQAMHPGWRALPQAGLHSPAGAFFWIGERGAPELGVIRRDRRIIEPRFINDRAMVALVR
jgi:hypothetical protein